MTKVFVRTRRHVGEGAGRPRFSVVAVSGEDLHFKKAFVRRLELEQIAAETGAEIIYLPRGEHSETEEPTAGAGRRRRHTRDED